MANPQSARSVSFFKAENRRAAVEHVILRDSNLSKLYDDGPGDDGKAGWVNMIRDQSGETYRLLFYINRIPVSPAYADQEPYEVLFGTVDPDDETPNFARALFTTSGAVNLLANGLPGEQFIRLLNLGQFEIERFPTQREMLVTHLLNRGCVYVCVYDARGQGIRILNLGDFTEIYYDWEDYEIQVRNASVVELGDTSSIRPFLLKLVAKRGEDDDEGRLGRFMREAESALRRKTTR